jgi:hypothetical protein
MQSKIEFELAKFGYTKENLYTKENRVAQKVKKIYRQTLLHPKYSWNDGTLEEDEQIVYVTKLFATQMPDEIYIMIAYDDSRVVLTKDWIKGQRIEEFNVLIETAGPGYDDVTVPHIIFESELKGKEKIEKIIEEEVINDPYKWSSPTIPNLKMEFNENNKGVTLTLKTTNGTEENVFIPEEELIDIQHYFHKSVGYFMFGVEPKLTIKEMIK